MREVLPQAPFRSIRDQIKTCTIRRQAVRWDACITVERGVLPPIPAPVERAVGVDRNLVNLAARQQLKVADRRRDRLHKLSRQGSKFFIPQEL